LLEVVLAPPEPLAALPFVVPLEAFEVVLDTELLVVVVEPAIEVPVVVPEPLAPVVSSPPPVTVASLLGAEELDLPSSLQAALPSTAATASPEPRRPSAR